LPDLRVLQRHVDELTTTDSIAHHTSTTTLHAWRDALAREAREARSAESGERIRR
jgi:hypothetical protein